jgi:hypothetical protein
MTDFSPVIRALGCGKAQKLFPEFSPERISLGLWLISKRIPVERSRVPAISFQ